MTDAPRGSRSADGDGSQNLGPAAKIPPAEPAEDIAHRWGQQEKPDRIGQEPGSEQQRPGDEDHGSIHQIGAREGTLLNRGSHPANLRRSLSGDEKRPHDRRHQDDPDGREYPDLLSDEQKQHDLDDGNDGEENEEEGSDRHLARLPLRVT